MEQLTFAALSSYWDSSALAMNMVLFFNISGALLLGILVGYERSFHGRAAGMRIYGLVCMTSAALTIASGYPGHWFGGHALGLGLTDPTRTIQGIVTGVGFLGAGVIMKDGLNISGLTTAASIWSSSAIGILVGLGFYAAAILLTFLSAGFMIWGNWFEVFLPSHHVISVTLQFQKGVVPRQENIQQFMLEVNYQIVLSSVTIAFQDGHSEWRFIIISLGKNARTSLIDLSGHLPNLGGIESFHLAHIRN